MIEGAVESANNFEIKRLGFPVSEERMHLSF